jgi:hypothetical protein
VKVTVFNDEINFNGKSDEYYIEKMDLDVKDSFKAIKFEGAVLPPKPGDYQFRMFAKPYGQISFKDQVLPKNLGPAGACLDSIKTSVDTTTTHLNNNTVYPFTLKMRTGCTLYNKAIYVQWKNGPKYYGVDNAPWEDIPQQYLFDCKSEDCAAGYYGETCQDICGECPANAVCNDGITGNGSCICKPGFYGPTCDDQCAVDSHCGENQMCENGTCVCQEGYFGQKCDKFCSRFATCGGHGSCSDDGMCLCDESYSGYNCEQHGNESYTFNDTLPEGAEPGMTITHYNKETFSGKSETWISETVDITMKDSYNSYIASGSFCPNESGKYVFKVEGKSYFSFFFNGEEIHKTPGPLGSCLPSIKETKETTQFLNAHQCYPIEIKLITGCKLYSQYLRFLMKVKENDWIIANNLISIQHADCLPNYFGKSCENRITIDCTENGRPNSGLNGNGLCICNDGYLGPDCRKKVEIIEPKCPVGVNLTVFNNEVSFVDVDSTSNSDTLVYDTLPYTYKALIFAGAFVPPANGKYQLRMMARPRGQIEFMNIKKPSIIGGAGCCDSIAHNDETTDVYDLYTNMTYPVKIYMQTGCGIISKSMRVQWKNGPKYYGVENAPWEDVPPEHLFACDSLDCVKGFYGSSCKQCSSCPENSHCNDGINGDGKCQCDEGYYGAECNQECEIDTHCENQNMKCSNGKCVCRSGYYGANCSIYCNANTTCNGNGVCDSTGKCSCKSPWGGDNCSVLLPDRTPERTQYFPPSEEPTYETGETPSETGNTGEEQGGGSITPAHEKVTADVIIILGAVVIALAVLIAIVVCKKKKQNENVFLTQGILTSREEEPNLCNEYWSDV